MKEMIQAYIESQENKKSVKVTNVSIDGATCVTTVKYSGITECELPTHGRADGLGFKFHRLNQR